MQTTSARPIITADNVGIHFVAGDEDILVAWGEIAAVCASQRVHQGTTHIEVFVDHYTGVDFRFHSVETGYEQTTAEMEKHLIGFRRDQLEAVASPGNDAEEIRVVWERDEAVQPFQLQPEVVDQREPTLKERAEMESARHASIVSAERLLGRPLQPEELDCIHVWFENGRIMGSTTPPLAQVLIDRRNAEYDPNKDATT